MAEEDVENGVSGWAGVVLGQIWAEHDQSMGKTLDWFSRRDRQQARSLVKPDQPHGQCLATENAQLRDQLDDARRALASLEDDYAELGAWADMAFRKLKQNGL